MIRIDEIYNNTFLPFIKKNIGHTRMFNCDPPGKTDPDSLCNIGSDKQQLNYIFFHDQEPIHLDVHAPLFDSVVERNLDLNYGQGPAKKAIVTSEYRSEFVDKACEQYGWKPYYYFFHGWAALDWYRGYNRTYLMPLPHERTITKTFVAPNRIVAGARQHRLLMLYHIFKRGLTDNWISCPEVCPAENISVVEAAAQLKRVYPDIESVFAQQTLPINFPGEHNSPMHSNWLSLFDESAESLLYLVTETVASGRRQHLTEKSFKPICLGMPFVIVGPQGSLQYLRQYGFKTFGDFWDERYDTEVDEARRIEKIADLLTQLNSYTQKQKQDLFLSMLPIIKHNYDHFYNGRFEILLWHELSRMLDQLKTDFT